MIELSHQQRELIERQCHAEMMRLFNSSVDRAVNSHGNYEVTLCVSNGVACAVSSTEITATVLWNVQLKDGLGKCRIEADECRHGPKTVSFYRGERLICSLSAELILRVNREEVPIGIQIVAAPNEPTIRDSMNAIAAARAKGC